MTRENNFLLGFGERLTRPVNVKSSGGDKNPPYDFEIAKKQVTTWLNSSNQYFEALPIEACPDDQVTTLITMHPRYTSKSDSPSALLNRLGLRVVGGKSKKIKPKSWGISKHPDEALTDQLFVMGKRASFEQWQETVEAWGLNTVNKNLTHFELIEPLSSKDKMKLLPNTDEIILLECVLHDSQYNKNILNEFKKFVELQNSEVVTEMVRRNQDLTFVPVYATEKNAYKVAQFSFIRAIREMPGMRPLNPNVTRNKTYHQVVVSQEEVIDRNVRVAIFDGGMPNKNPIGSYVRHIEPDSLSAPMTSYLEHGLNVTSALVFGPLDPRLPASRPLCNVDHVRVLDDKTGHKGDFEYYDVLDRILKVLDQAAQEERKYDFINISVGPDIAIDDGDITRWTSELDSRLAGGVAFVTVAAGNAGLRDESSGLNRVQPPSDAVNIFSVGACDLDQAPGWKKAGYSCIGPGRLPGLIKPDALAFGGDGGSNPFYALTSLAGSSYITGVNGTSFASPYALRTGIAVRTQLGQQFGPLAIRALLTHRATSEQHHRIVDVGWGRLETDLDRLITCDDDEALIVFQGELPVGEHLRAPIPMPESSLRGFVTVQASLVISPEVDISFPNAYTRAGLEVVFRPNSLIHTEYDNGTVSEHAKTGSFFSISNMNIREFVSKDDSHKWEPCMKASRRFSAKSLHEPCFDIYYHNRYEGASHHTPQPIPYALIVSIKAPRVQNLYEQVARTYANILVPLQPKTRIQIRP